MYMFASPGSFFIVYNMHILYASLSSVVHSGDFRVLMLKECLCGVTIKPISSEPKVISMKNGKKGNVLVRIGHEFCYARHER